MPAQKLAPRNKTRAHRHRWIAAWDTNTTELVMFILHQVHKLEADSMRPFESFARDELLPAVATQPDARLIWYASATDVETRGREAITMIALDGASALSRFCERLQGGDLVSVARKMQSIRVGVETRLSKGMRYNPLKFDLPSVSTDPKLEHPTISYMHDFVPPRIGQRRAYEDMMLNVYGAMSDTELLDVALWAGLEPVTGPIPEQINISRIQNTDVLINLLVNDIPRENKKLGSWMHNALKVRDRWTTRLVRCSSWSPLY